MKHFISTCRTDKATGKIMPHTFRCVGYFDTFEQADKCVRENWGDIHEGSEDLAVIEAIGPGLYAGISNFDDVRFYKWHELLDGYRPCDRPEELENICNFGIG